MRVRFGRIVGDRIVMDDEESTVCECGIPLDQHPPLPRPKPLASWMASTDRERDYMHVFGREWRSRPMEANA